MLVHVESTLLEPADGGENNSKRPYRKTQQQYERRDKKQRCEKRQEWKQQDRACVKQKRDNAADHCCGDGNSELHELFKYANWFGLVDCFSPYERLWRSCSWFRFGFEPRRECMPMGYGCHDVFLVVSIVHQRFINA